MRPLHPSAVPAAMIEKATARRIAGDWAGACAAAGVVLDVDIPMIRRHFGAEIAAGVEGDLRHLVPDLLRWYVPRDRTGFPRARAWYPLTLLPDGHAVIVHPESRTQRIELRHGRLDEQSGRRDDTFLHLRDRWDSRCTVEILSRCGGADRLPFFTAAGERRSVAETPAERAYALDDAGRHVAAWAVGGLRMEVLLFDRRFGRERLDPAAFAPDPGERNRARGAAVERSLAWLRPAHTTLPEAARRTLAHAAAARANRPYADSSPGGEIALTRIDVKGRSIVLDGARARLVSRAPYHRPDETRRAAEIAEFGTTIDQIPAVPEVLARRPEEFDALLKGPVPLHPLVHRALFPARPALVPPKPTQPRETIRVHCDHATHEVAMRNGEIVIPHTPAEIDRELALAALGGRVQGCVAAREGWRDPEVLPPRRMINLQSELWRVIHHGDLATVLAALDRGLDAHVRFRPDGETLLHLLPRLPGGEQLLPRLLAAGLDPNTRDGRGRTPLHEAVATGTPELVHALLRVGADPRARTTTTGYRNSAGYTTRHDLAFLRPLLQ